MKIAVMIAVLTLAGLSWCGAALPHAEYVPTAGLPRVPVERCNAMRWRSIQARIECYHGQR